MALAPVLRIREAINAEVTLDSFDAEAALLGCVLYKNEAMGWGGDLVTGEHFSDHMLGWLFDRVREMIAKDQRCEPIALDRIAQTYGTVYHEAGGLSLLARLVADCPPAENAGDYARIVLDGAVRRQAALACQEGIKGLLGDRDRPGAEVIGDLRSDLEKIEAVGAVGDDWSHAGDAVRAAIEHAQTRTGLIDYPTGIRALDTFIGGVHAGEVTILAARPGMGKTVGGLAVARANAERGLGVLLFSLEMTRGALALRLACDVAYDRGETMFNGASMNPTFDRAMKGELEMPQWRRLHDANAEIDAWPLEIDDRAGLTMAQIEGAARRQHRKWARAGIKPGPLIIDHLGKVRPSTDRRGNKHAEVADVSSDCQAMAKRLGVPVLALVQLNRAVENREGNQPQLSDLRQAGELEEDARQVMFLYRPEYYLREPVADETFEARAARVDKLQAVKNQLFWLVEKNSHGARGQVKSFCEIGCSAFRDW